jgi:hypothetical protein
MAAFTLQEKVRGGPIPWLPQSPYLTFLYFFLWGFVKDISYRIRVNDLPDYSLGLRAQYRPFLRRCEETPEDRLKIGRTFVAPLWGHIIEIIDVTANLVTSFTFLEKLLVRILMKNKIIQFLYRLLSFRICCI